MTAMFSNNINVVSLKYKPGQIGPKIKASENLHENSHTSQFEGSEYKYHGEKQFLNSNLGVGKGQSIIQIL